MAVNALRNKFISFGIVLIVAAGGLSWGYHHLDENGKISHTKHIPVEFSSRWVVGEFLDCIVSPNAVDEMIGLYCPDHDDNESPHELPVIIKAPLSRPGSNTRISALHPYDSDWRLKCQRMTDSIECKLP
jgi:hypothetical protein